MVKKKSFFFLSIITGLVIFHKIKLNNGHTNEELRKKTRIVIIGAGAAGIAAASKLYENGFENVRILEAENRIGGRLFTPRLGNYSVDLGAQWIHGEKGNAVFNIAYPIGLVDNSSDEIDGIDFMDSLGSTLDSNLLSEIFFGDDDDDDDRISVNMSDFESVGDYQEKLFFEKFKNNYKVFSQRDKYLHTLQLTVNGQDSSNSWFDSSTSVFNEYQNNEGNQGVNWKERGYSKILDVLMKRYPDPKKELPVIKNTIFNTEVVSIKYENNTEDVYPIFVTSSEGKIYVADHVIVTVSLGVLKKNHQSLFDPSLPQYKISAIESIGYGCVAKIYLLFDKPFWGTGNTTGLMAYFLWNESEKKEVENDPRKKWLLGMYGAMSVEYKPNILLLWVTGEYAKQLEAVSDEEVFIHSVENIHRFLGKKFNVTAALSMSRSRWCSNPHFRGTYSYKSIAAKKHNARTEMVERPLTNSVFFAGEATSKDRFSTVDGAVVSGWKAAKRLINLYKI